MENKTMLIPYVAMESALEKADRQNKRLWVVIIILIIALLGTNVAWTIYESQFETAKVSMEEVEQNVDNGGEIRIIGGDYYGNDSED